MKYCDLIGVATIVAVTQMLYVIVTRPLCFVLASGFAKLVIGSFVDEQQWCTGVNFNLDGNLVDVNLEPQ